MCGATLEDETSIKPQLDELMIFLQQLGSLRKHTPLISNMMLNVVELRCYNWGRSSEPTPAPTAPAPKPQPQQQQRSNYVSNPAIILDVQKI